MAVQPPSAPTLSANDRTVLAALFDPEAFPSAHSKSRNTAPVDRFLPSLPQIANSNLESLEKQQKELVLRLGQSEGAETAPKPELESIKNELDSIVSAHPNYASAYLNRAMTRRLLVEAQEGGLFSAPSSNSLDQIFADLSRAIFLTQPPTQSTPISPFSARILRTAYSHRAYLYLKASEIGVAIKGMGKTELEDMASRDFKTAAWYGDDVAREMSVRTNPYAKMCGEIVRNAIKEEREGKV
ncbi:hypothetical protein GQ43DRAFT_479621 [Delitschia confertaspora ATCC 74209]|uniref:Uncharacterized protein n=1 Tax=Delitschia confertaspora ATCC 74209 TaxID=1513339 RepID=A0A9P4JPB9_9PLEO|nr:hypothetical protein GQ43DRAFT_479621 [Delitschia confertaspora ATCC 74209]